MSTLERGIGWLKGAFSFARRAAPTPAYTVHLQGEVLSPVNCKLVQVLHPQGNGRWLVAGPERLCASKGIAYRVDPDMTRPVPSDEW